MAELTLLVIAKEPLPGKAKTRLSPPCTPEQAAGLAAAALQDTFAAVLAAPARQRILVLDGQPGAWVPPNMLVMSQVTGGFDLRLDAALNAVDGPVLLIGMDTPQVTLDLLDVAFDANGTDDTDVLIGPSWDGGFWALGLREPQPGLLLGVPMSSDTTCAVLRERVAERGLTSRDLRQLRDVDTVEDAQVVALEAPSTHFAHAWRRATGGAA